MGVIRIVGLFKPLVFGERVPWWCIHAGVLPLAGLCVLLWLGQDALPHVPLLQ